MMNNEGYSGSSTEVGGEIRQGLRGALILGLPGGEGFPISRGRGHPSCPRGEVLVRSEETPTASQAGSPLRQADATQGAELGVGLRQHPARGCQGRTGRG